MASVRVAKNNHNDPLSEYPGSLAASFPFELVETILLQLTVPELLTAAPNVPSFWRRVVERSKNIGQKLRGYQSIDGLISIVKVLNSETFDYQLPNGMLFVHRDSLGNESIVFPPKADRTKLKVLKTSLRTPHQPSDLQNERCSHTIHDFEGNVFCTKVWLTDGRVVFWRYVSA